MCSERKATNANEKCSRSGTCFSDMFLWSSPSCAYYFYPLRYSVILKYLLNQTEQKEVRDAALSLDDACDRSVPSNQVGSKTARAYAKTYKQGPPLVPAIITRRILTYINRIDMRKKMEFIQQMARYWSLKREVRRGAPLLKRLHLEPWTANAGAKVLTEGEKLMRLDVSSEF